MPAVVLNQNPALHRAYIFLLHLLKRVMHKQLVRHVPFNYVLIINFYLCERRGGEGAFGFVISTEQTDDEVEEKIFVKEKSAENRATV